MATPARARRLAVPTLPKALPASRARARDASGAGPARPGPA
eukprot:CAMPEP_0202065868 /NCGR_PEP_ID=MMETSP0963-20130614/52582_1 /ASSEMBLY_ACC=CAM_ASM_000494 /TAXON_ID=4773 /ORGANISM="Schizochytrium aggregatum, Strain ATCC28209" /LENGTH=40 /DNA_ID= /DNA_START= /DNA_END= /DNA_ORIENTATION=